MYIKYNSQDFPCKCRPGAAMVYRGLPDDFPAPVSGEIVLCADDGFVLRTDTAEDYLRQTFADGVLVLTNAPEAEEPEDKTESEGSVSLESRVAALEEAIQIGMNLYEEDLGNG